MLPNVWVHSNKREAYLKKQLSVSAERCVTHRECSLLKWGLPCALKASGLTGHMNRALLMLFNSYLKSQHLLNYVMFETRFPSSFLMLESRCCIYQCLKPSETNTHFTQWSFLFWDSVSARPLPLWGDLGKLTRLTDCWRHSVSFFQRHFSVKINRSSTRETALLSVRFGPGKRWYHCFKM